jgi:Zn-dependent protease with chaperone function
MLDKLFRAVCVGMCVSAFVFATVAHAGDERDRIQQVVDDLKDRLAIPETVSVTVVETNPKLFSVEPRSGERRTFLLSVEEDFAQALTDAELKAAVAHELGHVWIYTHFPYLQTEELANDIASRVISRDTLTPLYDKVWKKAAAD